MLQNKCNNPVSNHLRHDNEDSISSASEALKNYIDKYEREQLTGLASSITNLCTETPLQRQNISWNSTALSQEIKMAQTLLPAPSEHSFVTNLSADQLIIEDADAQVLSKSFSRSNTSSPGSSYCTTHVLRERKEKPRRRISSDQSSLFEDALTYSTSSRFRDSCVVDDVAVASQVEDVQRTWRLVSDLEADFRSSSGQRFRKDSDISLRELIERLTVTARRKEAKLHKLLSKGRFNISELVPRFDSLNLLRGECDSSSEDESFEDSLESKQSDAYRSELESLASSSDVMDDAIRLIDEKNANCSSDMMTSQSQNVSCARKTGLENRNSSLNRPLGTFLLSYEDLSQSVAKSREMQTFVSECLAEATSTDKHLRKEPPMVALKSMISTLQNLSINEAETTNDITTDFDVHGSLGRAMNHLEKLKKII